MIFQIPHHIKVLPPAIQDFKAGLLLIATDFAVMKRHGVAQPRATPHQFFGGIFHSDAPIESEQIGSYINNKQSRLATFNVFRLGILFEDFFRLFDFLGRMFIIAEIAREELFVCPEVNHTMPAEVT